uniref:Aminotransferase-like plant mobile domain-containing protein n=1 Tax=Populus davidiana TaxID=266767 RepID=A0A6M2FAS3_9ROSI
MEREEKELEDEIKLAGNALLSSPSSVSQLLLLLEKLEDCLKRVNQSPSKSMQRAVEVAMKALMAKELLNHSDVDVKVSVASCFNHILIITALTFSYDDEQMKEILQLIVASFENISDTSSPSYHKRVLILEKFANVRSCVLMVDLQCHSLIMEMFKHFLTNIREHHPDIVYSSMGLIMIIILDEIKEIPLEIVNLLLDCIRNRNQDVLPIAQKLGERIFENCGSKLAPYVPQANYCGQTHIRGKLQDSGSHTELVVKDNSDRGEGCGYQVFEKEGNREESRKIKEKDFKEKTLKEEGEIFLREFMKQKRSRKGVKMKQKPVVKEKNDGEEGSEKRVFGEENSKEDKKEKINREEGCKEQGFQEDHSEEGKKAKKKVFKEKKSQKEGVHFLRERVRSRERGKRTLKFEGKQAMDTKCSQRKMHEFLSNLKGKKRSIIENSIFSAFLDIPRCPINRNLVAALIECYDSEKDAFIVAGQPLKFCGKEIEKCIGLSFEGKRVDMNILEGHIDPQIVWKYFKIVNGNARIKEKSTDASNEKDDGEIKSSFVISESLLLQKLNLMSVGGEGEAEDFLRLSILYMFNIYFFPPATRNIYWWPLKFLENLHDFGSYAWGRAAYDYLHISLEKAASKLAGQNKFYVSLNACVPLLQTLATERISKLRVLAPPTNLNPSVLNYTENDSRSFNAIQKVLATLQPCEIKKCKDCEGVKNSTRLQGGANVKSTKRQKTQNEKEDGLVITI